MSKKLSHIIFILFCLGVAIGYFFHISEIKKRNLSPINHSLLINAAELIYNNPNVRRDRQGRLSHQTAAALIYYGMKSKNVFTRRQAAIACGEAKDVFGTPYLIDLLDDEDSDVKSLARKSLSQIWHKSENLGVEVWQKRWMENSRDWISTIIGLMLIVMVSFIFFYNLLKGNIKFKQLWFTIPLYFLVLFWFYVTCFTFWLGTGVIRFNSHTIYLQHSHGFVRLCSHDEYLVGRFMQRAWIVIGIIVLVIGIWQGIRYIRKKWYGNNSATT